MVTYYNKATLFGRFRRDWEKVLSAKTVAAPQNASNGLLGSKWLGSLMVLPATPRSRPKSQQFNYGQQLGKEQLSCNLHSAYSAKERFALGIRCTYGH